MELRDLGFGDLDELGPVAQWPIGRLFALAAQKSGPVFAKLVEHTGVSPSGFLVLRALDGRDGQRPSDLARTLMVSPATLTTVADTLARYGHVERRRDEHDRRVVRLHITETGRGLVAMTAERMRPYFWELYDVVDEADEPAVRRFLLSLITRFDAVLGEIDIDEILKQATSSPTDAPS
ncbi:MarR family winged helix-turn-helix transcriptional regulator [Actinomadura kijaniata]|uniref:MarR family winged helix-turn-helix transcriptional regulator n=1 Tax=Actinomadura kijaniata TaxID=46161 RepID=UPI00082C35DE|nr:MarR family transcriptional regulator [Actinomadura kijaniata]